MRRGDMALIDREPVLSVLLLLPSEQGKELFLFFIFYFFYLCFVLKLVIKN